MLILKTDAFTYADIHKIVAASKSEITDEMKDFLASIPATHEAADEDVVDAFDVALDKMEGRA